MDENTPRSYRRAHQRERLDEKDEVAGLMAGIEREGEGSEEEREEGE